MSLIKWQFSFNTSLILTLESIVHRRNKHLDVYSRQYCSKDCYCRWLRLLQSRCDQFCTNAFLSHHILNNVPAGVKVMEGVCVEKVLVEKEKVTGVLTDKGEVKCEVFVNCGGQV